MSKKKQPREILLHATDEKKMPVEHG